MKVELDDVITFLNKLSADAFNSSMPEYGDIYSTTAVRLFAAGIQGELKEATD